MIGDRIKALRKQTPYTQEDVAKKLGMGRANYSHIENNVNTPKSGTLNAIASLFGVTADYLLGRTDDPQEVLTPKLTVEQNVEINELMEESYAQLKQDNFSHVDIVRIQNSIMKTYYDLASRAKKDSGD